MGLFKRSLTCALPLLLLTVVACGKDDDKTEVGGETGSPDQVGSVCMAPEDCYPNVDHAELAGEVECLDRVPEGYCTHQCESDEDCCALEGECETTLPQVCAPFESTGLMMCFLSCEQADVDAAGAPDDQAFCQEQVSPWFICRSTGGGGANRKVCVPGDCGIGAVCNEDADCGPDLVCIGEIDGGYCGVRDCQVADDCPMGSQCINHAGINYCARNCDVASDCGFCRHENVGASCRADVEFVDGSGSVCVVG
ncbi:MAG: hypothetical protein R6X02_22365 [Enhygromyxa sp.]